MDIVFNTKWFEKHQHKLLWFLNTPIIRTWFRWCLQIKKYDCPINVKITEISPSHFSFGDKYFKKGKKWYLERTTDFRTHDKYSKRLYYAFKPFWYILHFFDWAMLDRVEVLTKLSFGFSTLTKYPDPGSGATTCDGYLYRNAVDETLADIRVGAGKNLSLTATTASLGLSASGTTNQFNLLRRVIATFDTSAIGSGSISNAVMSLFGNDKYTGFTTYPDLHVAGATPASNNTLVNGDYNQCQTTSFGSISAASFSTIAYNDITLNASGKSNIVKNGISKFSFQCSWDINNNFTGSWVAYEEGWLQINIAGTSADTVHDPKLVITYASTIDYSLVVSVGVFTVTGIDSIFTKSLHMITSVGSFTLTGIDILFKRAHGFAIQTTVGNFVLTGVDVNFRKTLHLITSAATFTLTGVNVTLSWVHNFILTVQTAVFNLTGIAANFTWHDKDKIMAVLTGAFNFLGKDINLIWHQKYTEEALQTNSFSKEGLSANSYTKEPLSNI